MRKMEEKQGTTPVHKALGIKLRDSGMQVLLSNSLSHFPPDQIDVLHAVVQKTVMIQACPSVVPGIHVVISLM